MIRPTTPADTAALMALADTTGIFQPGEVDELAGVLAGYHAGGLGDGHAWVTDDDGGPVGVAYYASVPMADRVWNLYLIAVHPDHQRRGRGAALLRHVEAAVAAAGGRLLLVETSGLGSFERTRAFYRAAGYAEDGRVRDYYRDGDDKVTFRKRTAPVA